MFLSKGAGASPIVTQLGPVCAQTYALSTRSKFTASRTIADKLQQVDIIITKQSILTYLNKQLCISYLIKHDYSHNDIDHREERRK